jgi:hypothetical protein
MSLHLCMFELLVISMMFFFDLLLVYLTMVPTARTTQCPLITEYNIGEHAEGSERDPNSGTVPCPGSCLRVLPSANRVMSKM